MYTILRGGCFARHRAPFCISRPNGNQNYLLLITRTPAAFHFSGGAVSVPASHAIIISPHTPYSYDSSEEYIDDWLHFDTEKDLFPFRGMLPSGVFFRVNDLDFFSGCIRQLLWENSYAEPGLRRENQDALMTLLLNHLLSEYGMKSPIRHYSPFQKQLQEIRLTMQSAPTIPLSAGEFASQLGISKSHFQHMYTELFGISFQKDYIQMRISYARDLLETTDHPIGQIPEMCGYSSDVHFYRQFKSVTGLTPAAYRKKHCHLA